MSEQKNHFYLILRNLTTRNFELEYIKKQSKNNIRPTSTEKGYHIDIFSNVINLKRRCNIKHVKTENKAKYVLDPKNLSNGLLNEMQDE